MVLFLFIHFLLIFWAFFASRLRILCAYFSRRTPIAHACALPASGGGGRKYYACVQFCFGFFLFVSVFCSDFGFNLRGAER